MPRKILVTEDQLVWLSAKSTAGASYAEMAQVLGCCVDTLKRILHKHGIVEFDGAKYARPPEEAVAMWDRPCLRCGVQSRRPKWTYYCTSCRDLQAKEDYLPAEWATW